MDAAQQAQTYRASPSLGADLTPAPSPGIGVEQPRVRPQAPAVRAGDDPGAESRVVALGVSNSPTDRITSNPPAVGAQAGRWRALVARYPWPVGEALSVLRCESGGDATAYRSGNYGLFQINAIHAWRVAGNLRALFDPETNVRVAFDIWRDNAGWRPWACKP
jgi:soluble lytic murein transglycosylase-like protein